MLLSFSIPAMLPMIANELDARGLLLPGVMDEIGHRFPDETEAADGRYKTTTIRPRHRKSRWSGKGPGTPLHCWWKSRTPEGFKLGTVPAKAIHALGFQNRGREGLHVGWPVQGDGIKDQFDVRDDRDTRLSIEQIARDDGFDSAEAMAARFVPKPGDFFAGWRIEW